MVELVAHLPAQENRRSRGVGYPVQVMFGLSIATMTLVRNDAEDWRLRRSLTALQTTGLPIFVADGGSPPAFQDWLASLPNIQFHLVRGLVPQVKWALAAAAAESEWILYTEPDKAEFFEQDLAAFLSQRLAYPKAGLLVASRDERSFVTFPAGQTAIEQAFNDLTATLLATEAADVLYGPLLMRRSLLRVLPRIADDAGWGWRIYLYARAVLDQEPIHVYTGYHPCPVEQQAEDGSQHCAYRLEQLLQNTRSLRQALLE